MRLAVLLSVCCLVLAACASTSRTTTGDEHGSDPSPVTQALSSQATSPLRWVTLVAGLGGIGLTVAGAFFPGIRGDGFILIGIAVAVGMAQVAVYYLLDQYLWLLAVLGGTAGLMALTWIAVRLYLWWQTTRQTSLVIRRANGTLTPEVAGAIRRVGSPTFDPRKVQEMPKCSTP